MILVEKPAISGVFLSSRFFIQEIISSSEIGWSLRSNLGDDGSSGMLGDEDGGGVGWILFAISEAMLVKKVLKWLAIAIGSVISELFANKALMELDGLGVLRASLRIDQVF